MRFWQDEFAGKTKEKNWSVFMNRFELKALGCLMYGENQWKSELAKKLGFSPKSHTLDRLLTGDYEIKQGVSDDVLELFFQHKKILNSAEVYFCFLNKNKKLLDDISGITILDCNGVNYYGSFGDYHNNGNSFLLLNNLEISENFNIEPFISFMLKTIKKDDVFDCLNELNLLFKNNGILYKNGDIFK